MKRYVFLILLGLLVVGCTMDQPSQHEPIINPPASNDDIVLLDPVETQAPNTTYQPVNRNQTRAPGTKTTTALDVQVVVDSLQQPWGMVQLPNKELLITQKSGTLVKVDDTYRMSFVDVPLNGLNTEGQGGLLDVAVASDFETSRVVFFTFSQESDQGTLTAVAKGVFNDSLTAIDSLQTIFLASPSFDGDAHYGSRIVVDGDTLYVSTGDRQSLQTRNNAQDNSTGHGKVLIMDYDGRPTQDGSSTNPSMDEYVFASGFRNVQGLAFDHKTNTLYASDMGPRGGDEINVVQANANYGWPILSYGIEYGGQAIGEGITQKEGLMQPLYYWDPAIAPSGIAFYSHTAIAMWENNLFVASLAQRHLVRLVIEQNKVIAEERLLENENQRFRDVLVSVDGSLYAITDQGRLYHIQAKE